jgi:hypothetical protein
MHLLASLEQGLGCTEPLNPEPVLALLPPETLRAYRQVMVWLIDGFALEYLAATPQLTADFVTPLTTVFPSTTASAITSLFTGLSPAQHGVLGWKTYLPRPDRTLTVLPGHETDPDGRVTALSETELYQRLRLPSLFDRLSCDSTVVSPETIAHSSYNRIMSGSARIVGYKRLEELPALLGSLARVPARRPQYVYVYWSQLDRLGHDHGPQSAAVHAHLELIDAAYARVCAQLEGTDTLLLITADHGMRAVSQCLDLSEVPAARACLRHRLTGEPRAALAHVQPGRGWDFQRALQQTFDDRIKIIDMETWLADSGFGAGRPHPELRARAGDFLLLPDPDSYLVDPATEDPGPRFCGAHGGLTAAECETPLFLRHFAPQA